MYGQWSLHRDPDSAPCDRKSTGAPLDSRETCCYPASTPLGLYLDFCLPQSKETRDCWTVHRCWVTWCCLATASEDVIRTALSYDAYIALKSRSGLQQGWLVGFMTAFGSYFLSGPTRVKIVHWLCCFMQIVLFWIIRGDIVDYIPTVLSYWVFALRLKLFSISGIKMF